MKVVVPDLISPSYFPAIAAVRLGCLADRGIEAELDLHFPVTSAVEALRAGEFDLLAGAAHALFHAASDGGGVRLVAALSRHMYWFLVVRSDLGLGRDAPLDRLRGLRIGAAPGPDEGLIQMLADIGVGLDEVDVGPVPGTEGAGVSFGVTAADALADGRIDGFWANGMGAEVAVRNGVGTVVVDARRGDGPPAAQHYTFASLMATEWMARERPMELAAVRDGLVEAQRRLREDPNLATSVAEGLFPPMEAELTATLIARDAPFYQPEIRDEDVAALVEFARRRGLTDRNVAVQDLVVPMGIGS